MACLGLTTGPFSTLAWSQTATASFNGKTLTFNNAGISVTGGFFFAKPLNHNLFYAVLGGKFLAILSVEDQGSGFPSQRTISVADFSNNSAPQILNVTANSNAVPLPVAQAGPGDGSVICCWAIDNTDINLRQVVGAGFSRSDTGTGLGGVPPFHPDNATISGGSADANNLIFTFPAFGSQQTQSFARPKPNCVITNGNPQSFGNVTIGGCPVPPVTRTFTIKNTGNDCLTINGVANNGPYTVTPFPPATLDVNQTLNVTVAFNPAATGSFNNVALAIAPVPPQGETALRCNGSASAAAPAVQFNQTTFDFKKHPIGDHPTDTLVITNNGTAPLNVAVVAGAANGFTWGGFAGVLTCGAHHDIPLDFTPALPEGPKSATFNVNHSAPGGVQAITLKASVCVANADIDIQHTGPIAFPQVQRGFRTVKIFTVANPGDGLLQFSGQIGGADATLYGLPDPNGSVSNPPSTHSYSVLPTDPCGGSAGTGATVVAVSFFANDVPRVTAATLTLTLNTATPAFPVGHTWVFPLSAEIIPPVALDVALVVDHSGSMNDPLGSRIKMDAAVSASQLFVELLRPDLDDRVAVSKFSTVADPVQHMVAVSSTTAPTQATIRAAVAAQIPPAAGNTAIAAGAVMAFKEIQTPRATVPPALTKAVIVLTDGIENRAVEDPPASGNWFTVLGGPSIKPDNVTPVNTSPITLPGGVKVYAVGLGVGNSISAPQLNALMQPPQNFVHVDSDLTGTKYFQLEKYFTQIYMDVADTQTITDPMFWINAGDTHTLEFEVLRGDVHALVVLFDWEGKRLPFYCVSPKGEVIDPSAVPPGFQLRSGFTNQTRFVEFKMPALDPDRYAGSWKVVIKHPGVVCSGGLQGGGLQDSPGFTSRRGCKPYPDPLLYGIAIGVGSNFRMQPYVTPGPVYVGDPILLDAVVTEAGLPVTGCTVTVDATSPSGIATGPIHLLDDGSHNDGAADNGEYARLFTQTFESGTYHFLFRAVGKNRDGQNVVREAMRDKAVFPKTPPHGGGDGGDPGRGGDDCCEKLLKAITHQTKLIEEALRRK